MASRDINDLQPIVMESAKRHRDRCTAEGIDLLIYCTLRDSLEQAKLYRQGRTITQILKERDRLLSLNYKQLAELLEPPDPIQGKKITFAGPGQSYHQYGLAYDCVPLINGKCLWKTSGDALTIWKRVGELGKSEGLEWAGDWNKFREYPHFQITSGRSIPTLMAERYLDEFTPSVITAADLSDKSESDLLAEKLNEPETKFFVVASIDGSNEVELSQVHSNAVLASNLNPAVRRVFWVRAPNNLSAELKSLLWQDSEPTVVSVLSKGTGLNRSSRNFTFEDVDNIIKIMDAFSWGA